MEYRNAQSALLAQAAEILARGEAIDVRGALTRELRQVSLTLRRPLERCIVVPSRHNNPFAAIYETLWVIAGRNDIADLSAYLPRAPDFSDDGLTWRAGYGPRLRSWRGIDQLGAIVHALTAERQSRQAVISFWDPALDNATSRDIPCTNWLQFMCRNGVLDLAATVRSNDLMWGFSGINTFEWSVLHEMVAHWLGVEVGRVTYFIGSLHLYSRHFKRAERMLGDTLTADPYPLPAAATFATPLAELDEALRHWFTMEARARTTGRLTAEEIATVTDPLLRDFLRMVNEYWALGRGEQTSFDDVQDTGLRTAGLEYVNRDEARDGAAHGHAYLSDFIVELHRAKTAAYGDSWKRRGELLSIVPNIARKVDRLERLDLENGAPVVAFDTAVDLFVYAVKYLTFLDDEDAAAGTASRSDGLDGFEVRAAALFSAEADGVDVGDARRMSLEAFTQVERSSDAPLASRIEAAEALATSAWALVTALADRGPWVVREAAMELDRSNDWKA
ncbi:thymidylate synthase [Microbacterium sp. NPDC055502]